MLGKVRQYGRLIADYNNRFDKTRTRLCRFKLDEQALVLSYYQGLDSCVKRRMMMFPMYQQCGWIPKLSEIMETARLVPCASHVWSCVQ